MKHLKLILAFLIITNLSYGQADGCDGQRYVSEVFANVTVTSNVKYGNSVKVDGNAADLFVDIYEPTGDTLAKRPIMILAHGGAYVGGSRTNSAIVEIAESLAKRGFVTASISYRLFPLLTMGLPDSAEFMDIGIKSVHDFKAAVRFFRESITTGNPYKIDSNLVLAGGYSAGAVTALHSTYLSSTTGLANYVQTAITNNGGIDGNSGNAGFSSKINGVYSYAGAMVDDQLIKASSVSLFSSHGTADNVVPFDYGSAKVPGLGSHILYMYGSKTLEQQAIAVGVSTELNTITGGDHGAPVDGTNLPIALNKMTNFFSSQHCLPTNPGSVEELKLNELLPYPNPTSDYLRLKVELSGVLSFTDVSGRIFEVEFDGGMASLKHLPNGNYHFQTEVNGPAYSVIKTD